MECNQNHSFHPNEETEEEEKVWRAWTELDGWNEEQRNLDKPAYCNRIIDMVKIFKQNRVICFLNSWCLCI